MIVVTAPSASDSVLLADSPVNAHVLRGDALRQANLADALDGQLGSVTLSNGTGSPYQSDVTYRGFAATSLLGSPTGLSVWLDSVRMNEPFGAIVNWDLIPMNALAGVQVLPGANPLFGLNTLGGALVLTTKNGADNPGAGMTVQGGSFARRTLLGDAGGTLANGKLDWFVSGNFDSQNGYRWYTQSRVSQVFAKLRWRGVASHAELGVIGADSHLHGTQGLPLSMFGMPQRAYTWPDSVANNQLVINLKADTRLAPALRLSGNVWYRRSSAHSSNSNASLGDACDGLAADCTALAPGGTARDLFANTPLFAGGAMYTGTLPLHDYTSGINTTLIQSDIAQRSFGGNLLIDLDAPLGGLVNDLNLGGSVEAATIRYGQNTNLAYLVNYQTVPMPWNFLYGSNAGFQGQPLINTVAIGSRNRAFTLFVRDMLKLSRTFAVTGSLSYSSTRISLAGINATSLDAGGNFVWTGSDGNTWYNPDYIGAQSWNAATGTLATAAVPAGALAGPEVVPVNGVHTYARINPALGLAWNPRADMGLFASYSEAMRAPTAIELACADPSRPCALPTGFNGDPALQAVIAHSLEAGFRATIARHIAVNGAVYRTRVEHDIQFTYAASGLGYFSSPGGSARQGFELGLSADFAKWQVEASYGHVAATFRDSFVDASGDTVRRGSHIPGIPAQSFKLNVTYSPIKTVTVAAALIAVAGQYAHGDEANRFIAVPGYALINLDLTTRPLRRVELFGHVTNLFDRRYATFGVWSTDVYNGRVEQFRTPAPGRALTGGVRYRFGAG